MCELDEAMSRPMATLPVLHEPSHQGEGISADGAPEGPRSCSVGLHRACRASFGRTRLWLLSHVLELTRSEV